jgi:hypothetical protein
MGMFDHIHYKGREYQTKDTPNQILDNYKIEQDQTSGHWFLWHEKYECDWVEEADRFGGGYLKQYNHHWVCCHDFDGLICFYWYRTEEDQEEYEALFMNGQMLKIKTIRGEPLTEWLTKGIEQQGSE